MEIIDFSSPSSHCNDLHDYVKPTYYSAGGLILQDYPLICGGYPENNLCFAFKNATWEAAASMAENKTVAASVQSPFPEDPFSVVIIGGKANSSISYIDEIWIENIPDLVKLNHHCVVMINSTAIMVIGGYQNDQRSNRTYMLDTNTNIWEEGPPLLQPRDSQSCGRIRSDKNSSEFSLIVAGGYAGKSLKSTEILDDITGYWRKGPDLPTELFNPQIVEDSEGGVIIIGGERILGDGTWIKLDTLFHLPNVGQDAAWVELPQKLKTARARFIAFMVPDGIADCN